MATCFALLCLSTPLFPWQAEHPISGRKIAQVMGVGGADWLDRPERELEEHPEAALDALQLKPGMTIADVGAGTGYFTLRMARRVAPGGRVYGVDIQPEMLTKLRKNAAKANISNIQGILGTESDPKLPVGELDLILMVDVYHEFSQPQKMLAGMRAALKANGRLVLIEYRKEDPAVPIRLEHKMTIQEAKSEVEAEGFRLEQVLKTLPRQHILIFKKNIQ
ncbi:MAG: methyltransferase domain-containing protein [Bryobacteraceae bacterium]